MKDYFYHYRLNDPKPFKSDVDAAVKECGLECLNPHIMDISTSLHGKQYHLMEEQTVPYLNGIVSQVKKMIDDSLNVKNIKLASAWTVYGEKGTFHTMHQHNTNNDICSVIYLDVQEEIAPHKYGSFYYYLDGIKLFPPGIGDVLIFPATLWHGSYPQQTDMRHVLNLDFTYETDLQ